MQSSAPHLPDLNVILPSADDAIDALTIAVRESSDASLPAVGHWSVGDVAAHVADLFGLFVGLLEGRPSPVARLEDMSEVWQRHLDARPDRHLHRLADEIETNARIVLTGAGGRRAGARVTWHAGIEMPVESLVALVLSEAILHGHDVATADRKPWKITRTDALLTFAGLQPVIPHFVNGSEAAGISVVFDMRPRGGDAVHWVFDDGVMHVRRPAGRADVHISFDPVGYLLVAYGRRNAAWAVLSGALLAWGRRPWLGLRLPRLIDSP